MIMYMWRKLMGGLQCKKNKNIAKHKSMKRKLEIYSSKILTSILLLIFILNSVASFSQTTLVSNVTEFNVAVQSVSPGGTIKLKNGNWENVQLGFYAQGTETDSITLTAETPGGVVLSGTSKLELAGKYLIVSDLDFNGGASSGDAIISFRKNSSELANHSRVTNCRIIDYNPASDAIAYKWVSIYGGNNRVDHCNFEGKNNEGALLVVWLSGSANYHRIDHNYFADIPELGRNGGETIRIGTSTNSMTESRTIVEHNLFESCDGEIEIISNKSGFNIYRYNTFRDNEGTLTLRHGNDCEVYGNFFFGENKRSGGVRIIGERHKVYNNYFEGLNGDGFRAALCMTNGVPDSPLNRYFQVKDAQVVHNTFVSCKEPFAIGEGKSDELSLPPINCTIANNIVDKTTGSKAFTFTDEPENFTYTNNYVNGNAGITDDGIINQDPGLVMEEDLWRINESSSVVDNGTGTFDYVISDIDGQNRDSSPDIGCDELAATTRTIVPLTKEDIGYNWEEVDMPDPDPVTTIIDQEQVKLHFSNNWLRISGIGGNQYPLRVKLVQLDGIILYDDTTSVDTLQINGLADKMFILLIFDNMNRLITKRKLRIGKPK